MTLNVPDQQVLQSQNAYKNWYQYWQLLSETFSPNLLGSSQVTEHLCNAKLKSYSSCWQQRLPVTRFHSAPPEIHFKIATDFNGSRTQLSKFPP